MARIYDIPKVGKLRAGVPFKIPGVASFPANWLDKASDVELARYSITAETVPDPQPKPETPEQRRDRREREEFGRELSPVERALLKEDAATLDTIRAKLADIEAGR